MKDLFDIKTVYFEREATRSQRGLFLFKKFPDAKKIPVSSHWQIPELNLNSEQVESWNKNKREVLILGTKKKLYCRENGRSTDFVAPSHASGCAGSCSYCYVARRKGYANPITIFTNIDQIITHLRLHTRKQGKKNTPNQCDPALWTYDIGENNDCSVDAYLSENVKDLVSFFKTTDNAKASFATKFVNRDMLDWDPEGRTRIRFSLMPPRMSKLLDVRTSPIKDRIAAIEDFRQAGYEVHLNFSPIVVYEGWTKDWEELLSEVDQAISPTTKQQLKCEVIFLTHNEELHQLNKRWHPKAEEVLWTPNWQEPKVSQTGGHNVRYKWKAKQILLERWKEVHARTIPYCNIRYAF